MLNINALLIIILILSLLLIFSFSAVVSFAKHLRAYRKKIDGLRRFIRKGKFIHSNEIDYYQKRIETLENTVEVLSKE